MNLAIKAAWQLEYFEEKLPEISDISLWVIRHNKPYPYPISFNNYKDAIAFLDKQSETGSIEEVGISLFKRIRNETSEEEPDK
jgi:hypothetical protein